MNMQWQYANSLPKARADFKSTAESFYVEEEFVFTPEGKGEFLYLFIEKVGLNTDFLAKLLAQHANLPANKVTYSGVKDRHAVTRQWFCLHVLNTQPDFSDFSERIKDRLDVGETVEILQQTRHLRKLKIGAHSGNLFKIRLSNLAGDIDDLQEKLVLVSCEGVPNYFGPQRFGIAGNNLEQGVKWLDTTRNSKRSLSKKESFWISAVRSWFFNQALSRQVADGTWNQAFTEDRLQIETTEKQIKVDQIDTVIKQQLQQMVAHPLMPLPYKNALSDTSSERSELMRTAWYEHEETLIKLISLGFNREERCTRLFPQNMSWEIVDDQLIVSFRLPKGGFATSVLRELLEVNDCSGMKEA